MIFSESENGQVVIYVTAENLSGTIVGVKELIEKYQSFISPGSFKHVIATDIGALSVYRMLKEDENYGENNRAFADTVEAALYDKMYKVKEGFIDVPSPEGNMKYQYRHLEPVKDDILRAYIDKDGYPVMMAGGLYSNIDTWDEFGRELANEGFDIYLIELTGGEGSECDECYNYPYEHLVDNVIPEYVDFVLDDSGEPKVKYVGHSNGCRSMLSSLNEYSSNSNSPMSKVDTMFGLGCPINLNDDSLVKYISTFKEIPLEGWNSLGDTAINVLTQRNSTHISKKKYSMHLLPGFGHVFNWDFGKISLNLQTFYNDLYHDRYDLMDLGEVSLNEFYIYGGFKPISLDTRYGIKFENDGAVPISDIRYAYSEVTNVNKKNKEEYHLSHGDLIEDKKVLNDIKNKIK